MSIIRRVLAAPMAAGDEAEVDPYDALADVFAQALDLHAIRRIS